MKHHSDEELLALYQKGDADAFDEFFRRHHRMIFQFLVTRLPTPSEAEDAVQDTFLKIHRHILTYSPEKRALPWTFAIARNAATDRLRARRPHEPDQAPQTPDPQDLEAQVLARQELDHVLQTLRPEDRDLIRQRFVDGESYEDLARIHASQQATIRQRLSRILRRAKKLSTDPP